MNRLHCQLNLFSTIRGVGGVEKLLVHTHHRYHLELVRVKGKENK